MAKTIENLSIESIQTQDGAFFDGLTDSIEFLKANGTFTTEAVIESQILDRIRYSTGMWVDVVIKKEVNVGAYVMLPSVDKNHPFVNENYRKWYSGDAGMTAVHLLEKIPKGIVNTETGKVGGLFSQIRCDLSLGYDLIQGGRFTAREVAAVILHELGHLFTYFLHLGTTVQSALFSSAAAKNVMEAQTYEERVKILSEAERTFGIELPTKEALAKLNPAKVGNGVQAVILSTVAEKQKSEAGSSLYELRACEQIADDYAVQHGASKDLVTALDKVGRIYGEDSYRNGALFVMLEVCKLLIFIGSIAFGAWSSAISMSVYIMITNPLLRGYDKPGERAELIKKRCINQLQDRGLTKEEKLSIQADIDVIDKVISGTHDKSTLLELFWANFRRQGRAATKQLEFNKEVEELIFNETFKEAAAFSTMA